MVVFKVELKLIQRLVLWVKSKFQFLRPKKFNADNFVKRAKRKMRSKKHFGAHYYLGNLLDRLEEHFDCLKLIKKADKDAYDLFKNIGMTVSNDKYLWNGESAGWVDFKKLPSMGGHHFCDKFIGSEKQDFHLRAVYFQKIKRPFNVQPTNHQTFELTLLLTYKRSKPFAEKHYVAVDEKGSVYPLKICTPKKINLPIPAKSRYRNCGGSTVNRLVWDYHAELYFLAKHTNKTIEQFSEQMFWHIMNAAMGSTSGLTIRVHRGGETCAFAIDMERTPYFFDDREKTINVNGKTKKIFHIVRGHWRKKTGGNKKFIKTHFRGLRKFKWNGFDIVITLSGLHHNSQFNFAGSAEHHIDPQPKMVTPAEMGKTIGEHLNQ